MSFLEEKHLKLTHFFISLGDIFTVNTMKQLNNSFIFSYIDYCHRAWGRTYQNSVNSIYIMLHSVHIILPEKVQLQKSEDKL